MRAVSRAISQLPRSTLSRSPRIPHYSSDIAANGTVATAAVVTPAEIGEGGLGAAGAAIYYGLVSLGIQTAYVSGRPSLLATSLNTLQGLPVVRRNHAGARLLDRRRVLSAARRDVYDMIYAMPGFLPRATCRPVLHAATFHPRTVRSQVTAARREAGGGAGFITRREAERLTRELHVAQIVRVESDAVAHDLAAHGVPARRIVVARPGVDLARFRPGPKHERMRIAFVGAHALWKGFDVVVALARALPQVDVVTIGGPVCRWSRRLLDQAPLSRAEDVTATLASSHLLVLPSVTDGFGYVVLEALASGSVPIVTPTVGAAEILRTLDPDLVQSRRGFVDAVARIARRTDLDLLAARGRALAELYPTVVMGCRAAEGVCEALS